MNYGSGANLSIVLVLLLAPGTVARAFLPRATQAAAAIQSEEMQQVIAVRRTTDELFAATRSADQRRILKLIDDDGLQCDESEENTPKAKVQRALRDREHPLRAWFFDTNAARRTTPRIPPITSLRDLVRSKPEVTVTLAGGTRNIALVKVSVKGVPYEPTLGFLFKKGRWRLALVPYDDC